jgi:hypothetical protein
MLIPINLGEEDFLALITFPVAIFFFSLAVIWENDVHKTANKPLNQKLQELETLKKEAEELNRSATILLHGKKMREVTKLEDVIAEMRRRRGAFRRRAILTFVFYLIQLGGFLCLYFIARKFLGMRIDLYSSSSNNNYASPEIVMLPHSFTSFWISAPNTERHLPTRYAIPVLGQIRSFGIFAWYVMCLVTCRVIYEGLDMKRTVFGNNNNNKVVMVEKNKIE